MIEISKESNPNYLCKIVKLQNLRKHSNADRLQIVSIDFQNVITGLDASEGDIYVYFPIECKINKDFLSYTNSFRDKELNADKEKQGFFEDNCRVKAMKLRGEKSMGYIVPISEILQFVNTGSVNPDDYINREFDVINGVKLLEKYVVKTKSGKLTTKQGKLARESILVDGQVHFHVSTENLRKNSHKLNLTDIISITYKVHGTSWWVSNVLAKRKLTWKEKLSKFFGVSVVDKEYRIIYGSRKVVKNQYEGSDAKSHFYGYDLWADIKDKVADHIPKGFTLYGECVGYTKEGSYIQGEYDYGCDPCTFRLEVYRITHTNPDGIVIDLSYPEIKEFCTRVGLFPSHLFYHGTIEQLLRQWSIDSSSHWQETLIRKLEEDFNEKDCFMCKNKVPAEGIVVRRESLFSCDSYKLKSFRFLEKESKELDKGVDNLEE